MKTDILVLSRSKQFPIWLENLNKKGVTLRIGPQKGTGQSQKADLTSRQARALAYALLSAAERIEIRK